MGFSPWTHQSCPYLGLGISPWCHFYWESPGTAQLAGPWICIFCGLAAGAPPLIHVHLSHWTPSLKSRAVTHVCYHAWHIVGELSSRCPFSFFKKFCDIPRWGFLASKALDWESGDRWSQETCRGPCLARLRTLRDGLASLVQDSGFETSMSRSIRWTCDSCCS